MSAFLSRRPLSGARGPHPVPGGGGCDGPHPQRRRARTAGDAGRWLGPLRRDQPAVLGTSRLRRPGAARSRGDPGRTSRRDGRCLPRWRRQLRPDGTLWLNHGDCHASSPNGRSAADTRSAGGDDRTLRDKPFSTVQGVPPRHAAYSAKACRSTGDAGTPVGAACSGPRFKASCLRGGLVGDLLLLRRFR